MEITCTLIHVTTKWLPVWRGMDTVMSQTAVHCNLSTKAIDNIVSFNGNDDGAYVRGYVCVRVVCV